MSNVKPGDLAMVVNAPSPWAGATCTVARYAPESVRFPNGPFWWVEMARPMDCWSPARGPHMSSECVIPDAHLRKIGGPDVNVDAMQFNPLAHEQAA